MDCIEEMDKFLEMCKLARLNQKEIEYMNRLITSNKIKSIIKKTSNKQKSRIRWLHRWILPNISVSSVQFSRSVFATPWIAACQASLSITNSRSSLKLMSIDQWCLPAISSSVVPFSSCPPIPPSIRVFSNESTLCMRWPKYWSFSFIISPSNEYSGLISFRMDWLDLLAVQGTLKSLLQHHSSKASSSVLIPDLLSKTHQRY